MDFYSKHSWDVSPWMGLEESVCEVDMETQ